MPTLHFKGKTFVQNHHLAVPYCQLVPDKKKSLTDKVSLHDNLIIHGDNLKALKALLPLYAGKVKCIYIDPPYNTGSENWVYNDNVNSPMMKEWLGNIVDKDDFTRHDKWLCMMMPRLKLLRELLSEEGIIFISIDDNEIHNLRNISDEIFGEENFVAIFARRRRLASGMRDIPISPDQEYVLTYAKQLNSLTLLGTSRNEDDYPFSDKKGKFRSTDLTVGMTKEMRPNQHYALINPKNGNKYYPPDNRIWRFYPETMNEQIKADNIIWPDEKNRNMSRPRYKTRFNTDNPYEKTNPVSTWIDYQKIKDDTTGNLILFSGMNQEATKELREIFNNQVLDYPKPVSLVKSLIELSTNSDSIVIDSFAGSGTTAHAVLALNKEDGGNRKFILVECEDYADKITAERVRRVIKGVKNAKDVNLKEGLGGTFSYFELGDHIEMESILQGKSLPSYEELARYVFYTATGEEFDPSKIKESKNYIGSSKDYEVYLYYKPDIEYLKSTALTLDRAESLGPYKTKRRLVFAPAKYLDNDTLMEMRIDFCQLPFEIYRLKG